jgi:hypothetical protein
VTLFVLTLDHYQHHFYIDTLHRYSIMGDLEFIHDEQCKPTALSDCTQQKKGYQCAALSTKQSDNTICHHVIGTTRIVDKTADKTFCIAKHLGRL